MIYKSLNILHLLLFLNGTTLLLLATTTDQIQSYPNSDGLTSEADSTAPIEDDSLQPPRPPGKFDIAFVIDTSEQMSVKHLGRVIKVVLKLLKYFSISPGTTRVALFTVGDVWKQLFTFREHVNRECLMKSIKKSAFKLSKRKDDFNKLLRTGIQEIKDQQVDVEGQRRITLYLTNNKSDVILLNRELEVSPSEEFTVLLFGNPTNTEKLKFKEGYSNEIQSIKYPIKIKHLLRKLKLDSKQYGVCEEQDDSRVVDECNRKCTCRKGKLKNCYRERKEFTSMTSQERRRYLKAYKTLTTKPPYKDTYERFVFMHYKYFCWGIHNRELFLPWHRWFLSMMEDLLKGIDCGVTIPYWDWSYVSDDPWNRTNLWRSTDDGLGSNGNRYKGYCVEKGMFRESEWRTPYWEDPMDIILSSADQINGKIDEQRGHLAFCLRRAFKGHTPSYNSVQRTLQLPAGRFKDFDIQMRHNFHDRIHNIVGGTMSTHYAGNTPEFFLHHSFLDKIWYKWQTKSADHKWVHFLQRNTSKMMGTEYTHLEYTDSHDLPRCIKVKYEDFPLKGRSKRDVDIDSMRRMPSSYWKKYLEESWDGTFPNCSRTKKEKRRAKYLHKILDGPTRNV